MSLNKKDVWADLRYVLEKLDAPLPDIHSRLKTSANLDDQSEGEAIDSFFAISLFSGAYFRARVRADTKDCHEAIEKGLKTLLRDGGMSEKEVRVYGHDLPKLLTAIKLHNPMAFNEIERCFEITLDYLEGVTSREYVASYRTNIADYFEKHGIAKVFEANRYESLEGKSYQYGMIGLVYREIIRALLSLIFGGTPKDIFSRVEDEARREVLAESKLDPTWDVTEWLSQGPVRPRLEIIENLNSNKVLFAAVRRCARESKDREIQYWAEMLRSKSLAERKRLRAERIRSI